VRGHSLAFLEQVVALRRARHSADHLWATAGFLHMKFWLHRLHLAVLQAEVVDRRVMLLRVVGKSAFIVRSCFCSSVYQVCLTGTRRLREFADEVWSQTRLPLSDTPHERQYSEIEFQELVGCRINAFCFGKRKSGFLIVQDQGAQERSALRYHCSAHTTSLGLGAARLRSWEGG